MTLRSVRPFTDSSKVEGADQRLVITRWKATKENPKPHIAVCTSIPALLIKCEPEILSAAMTSSFHDMQESMIRQDIEKRLAAKQTLPFTLDDGDYSFEAVKIWAEQQASSARLSKDNVALWFTSNMQDILLVNLAAKNDLDPTNAEHMERLNKAISNYKAVFMSLAAPTTHLADNDAKKLQAVLALCENQEDLITTSLTTRIIKMLEPTKVSLSLDL